MTNSFVHRIILYDFVLLVCWLVVFFRWCDYVCVCVLIVLSSNSYIRIIRQ